MNTHRYVFGCIAFVWCIVLGVWWNWPDRFVHIVFCDVGQGDGILISYGFTQWVIDTGPDARFVSCFASHIPFFDRTIEAVLLTHADADHIGGFLDLSSRYQIRQIYMNQSQKSSKLFKTVEDIVTTHGMRRQQIFQGDTITITASPEEIKLKVLWPPPLNPETEQTRRNAREVPEKNTQSEENQRSLSGVLSIGTLEVLLTGDVDCEVEEALIHKEVLHKVDVLKVAHHGSKFSTCDQFIRHVVPETAIVSVGKNNRYGHPDSTVISRLEQAHCRVLRTDVLGTIEIVSDGDQYWLGKEWLSSMKISGRRGK